MLTLTHEGLFVFGAIWLGAIWFGLCFSLGGLWMLVKCRNAADRRAKRKENNNGNT